MARKFDLAGRTSLESALIDMYADQLGDLFDAQNQQSAEQQNDVLFGKTWPTNLQFFETRLSKNGNGLLVGWSVSWADIYLAQITEFMGDQKERILANFPLVKALDSRIRNNPRIADWLNRRPKN